MKSLKHLSKFIDYILGKHPDEFGLVPDKDGFIKIKDLLKVLSEEEGFRYIRRSDLDEILINIPEPSFEICDQFIRAHDRNQIPEIVPAEQPPKLLFTCVRKKAHRFAFEKGIFPVGHARVVLADSAELAERIGKRFDGNPVLMTVQVAKALEQGIAFYKFGKNIFLTDTIPVGCFTGPALPKEKTEVKKPKIQVEIIESTPGSYFPDLSSVKDHKNKENRKKKKDIAWKRERKHKQKIGEKW